MLREFTHDEKLFIKKIVEIRETGETKRMVDLEVAKLLKDELRDIALQWSVKSDPPTITIYPLTGKDELDNARDYYKISDYIYLIEELVSLGFVKLQAFPYPLEDKFLLYDQDKYTFEDGAFWIKSGPHEVMGKMYDWKGLVNNGAKKEFYSNFAYDLNKIATSMVYPLPLAISYVKNGFKTLEDERYEKSRKESLKSLHISQGSFLVALFAALFTILTSQCSHSLDGQQFRTIIKELQETHIPTPLNITTNDTIPVSIQPSSIEDKQQVVGRDSINHN